MIKIIVTVINSLYDKTNVILIQVIYIYESISLFHVITFYIIQ
jgi:hypothetical protein